MKSKNNKRRYFLHKKVKEYIEIDVFRREISVSDSILSDLNEEQKSYLFELRDVFGYNLQYYIE